MRTRLELLASSLLIPNLRIDTIRKMLKAVIVACIIGAIFDVLLLVRLSNIGVNNFITGACIGSIGTILLCSAYYINKVCSLLLENQKDTDKVIIRIGELQDELNN